MEDQHQEQQLHIIVNGAAQPDTAEKDERGIHSSTPSGINYNKWIKMAIYSLFVLSGQAVATLLGRVYYDKGGKSNWMATLVQLVGFPILLPCYLIRPSRNSTQNNSINMQPRSPLLLAAVYISLGLFVAVDCLLYSIGLKHLPVSTYSIICASQLAFTALFSFFLNSQKFTFLIFNSLVLLTISSTLLIFQEDSDKNPIGVSKGKYAIGFLCTIAASAGCGLQLSLAQLSFKKVIKRETFSAVLDMTICIGLVASCAILIGLFASGDWKTLTWEMENFQSGKLSYLMNLIWTAIAWQVFAIGSTGLIFEMSSLFSIAIGVLGLPIVPCSSVIFLHDKMGAQKVIAMILATWGFISYVYQNYLDDIRSKAESKNVQ